MCRNEINHLDGSPRNGGWTYPAALAGMGFGVVALLVTLATTVIPSNDSAYLGPLMATSDHHSKHRKHHHSDNGSGGAQSLSTDGSTQHNTGCSKVIHSLGDLDGAMQDASGSNGAICVQMNSQSVGNTFDQLNGSDGSSDSSD